jgi:hypothetical protein
VIWAPPYDGLQHDPFEDPGVADALSRGEPVCTRPRNIPRQQKDFSSRSLSDLIKAYSTENAKFSGDTYEESLLTIRRRYFTLCSMLNVTPMDACEATHLPFCGTALEYYYTHLQSIAVDAAAVFDGMKLRFQTQDVQDRALVKWQSTTFASSRLADIEDCRTQRWRGLTSPIGIGTIETVDGVGGVAVGQATCCLGHGR